MVPHQKHYPIAYSLLFFFIFDVSKLKYFITLFEEVLSEFFWFAPRPPWVTLFIFFYWTAKRTNWSGPWTTQELTTAKRTSSSTTSRKGWLKKSCSQCFAPSAPLTAAKSWKTLRWTIFCKFSNAKNLTARRLATATDSALSTTLPRTMLWGPSPHWMACRSRTRESKSLTPVLQVKTSKTQISTSQICPG